jgi:predicted DNA-binding protein (MmcQ/YjbR family)
MSPEDRRLTRLTRICLELPEASREDSGRHATFRVRSKTFSYYLDDHRGDEGIVGIVCKARPGESAALIAAEPERFYPPAYLAHRGWVGLRLDTGSVDWDEVAGVVVTSYLLTAPKRLAAEVAGA